MCDYYTEVGFKDWVYPGTDTPMLKLQPLEFEIYTAGSTHYNADAQMKAAQAANDPSLLETGTHYKSVQAGQ